MLSTNRVALAWHELPRCRWWADPSNWLILLSWMMGGRWMGRSDKRDMVKWTIYILPMGRWGQFRCVSHATGAKHTEIRPGTCQSTLVSELISCFHLQLPYQNPCTLLRAAQRCIRRHTLSNKQWCHLLRECGGTTSWWYPQRAIANLHPRLDVADRL